MRAQTGLTFDQAPPLQVPLRFLLTAPLWGAVAALLLLHLGPDALVSRWTPGVLALTHAITLGVMAQVMIGALLQLLPVLAGASVRSARILSAGVHALLNIGLLALLLGFLGYAPAFWPAWILLAIAFGWFIPLVLFALWRTPVRHASVTAMRLALLALAMTVGLGLTLLSGHARLDSVPRQYTQVHMAWGLAGWVAMLIIGVAYQVVPMFQLTAEYPLWLRRLLAPALFLLILTWTATVLGRYDEWSGPVLSMLLGGLALFGMTTLYLQLRRRRRVTDATLQDWRYGIVCGLVALAGTAMIEWNPEFAVSPGADLFMGMLVLLGFAVALMIGMLYKIVPFLLWLNLHGQLTGMGARRRLPSMKAFISDAAALWQSRLYWLSVMLLLLAVYQPWLLRPAAALLAVAFAWLSVNLLRALRLHRACSSGLGTVLPRSV